MKWFTLSFSVFFFVHTSGQVTENFDSLSDIIYGNEEEVHNLLSGTWVSLGCIINSDKERGDSGRAVRFRHNNETKSYLEFHGTNANGIAGGIGTVSFWVRHWTDNTGGSGVSFNVEYKQKDASTWTQVGNETQVSSPDYMQKSFTVNQSADDLYLRIISVGNTERLLLDDFELTGHTLGFENWHQSVSIYPNPTQIKTVYFQGMPGSKEVMIYDLHGKQLLHKTVNEHLNIESLVPGLYVAKIHVQQQIFTEKLVVR